MADENKTSTDLSGAEISALIASLQEHSAADVAEALQEHAPGHYQKVYQRGYSSAHSDAEAKLSARDEEIAALKQQVQAKGEELEAAGGSGDAEVRRLKEKVQSLEESNQQLKAAKQSAEEAAQETVTGLHRERFQERLASALIEKGVDADYAREVLVQKHAGRVDVQADENGAHVRFMDEDGVTPIQASSGNLASVAADKIKSGVDAKWITSKAAGEAYRGGGASSSGGSAGQAGSAAKYDRVREEVNQKRGEDRQGAGERLKALTT